MFHITTAKKVGITLLLMLVLFDAVAPSTALGVSQLPQFNTTEVETLPPPPEDVPSDCAILNVFCQMRHLFNWVVKAVMVLLLTIVGLVITLMSAIIDFLINLSQNMVGSDLVRDGFRVTLGVANLGFVLAIIVIAFATILRIEGYEMKKTLSKLVIAAVLVNFSLGIAGVFIDFTNVFATFFIEKANPGVGGALSGSFEFGKEMMNALNVQKLIDVKSQVAAQVGTANTLGFQDLAAFFADIYTNVLSLFLALAFSVITLIVFAALGVMLVVRYVYLTILLILMPLAWLFWIVPDLSHLWKKWWDKFLQWTFFLPAVTFFLYLAMLSSRGIDTVVTDWTLNEMQNKPTGATVAIEASVLQKNAAAGLLGIFVKLGLFMGALLAGQAMGIAGAKGGMDIAKKMGTKFTGYKKGALGDKLGEYSEKLAKKASKVPLLRMGLAPISKPVRQETAKIKGEKAEKIKAQGMASIASRVGELKTTEDYEAAKQLLGDELKGKSKLTMAAAMPFTKARRTRAEAIMGLAEIDKQVKQKEKAGREGIGEKASGWIQDTGKATVERAISYIPFTAARVKRKVDKRVTRKTKVEKEEKKEEEEKKFRRLVAAVIEETKHEGGGETHGGGGGGGNGREEGH